MKFKACLKFVSCFSYTAKQYQCDVYQDPYNPTEKIESEQKSS